MLRSVNGCWSWRGLIREKNVLVYRGFILLLSVGIPSVFCLEHTPAVPFVRFHFGLQQCPALAAALGTPELFPNLALPRNSHRAGAAAGALDSPKQDIWKFTASNSARENDSSSTEKSIFFHFPALLSVVSAENSIWWGLSPDCLGLSRCVLL